MNRVFAFAVLIVGVALIITGIGASDSINSSFSRLFTGTPTAKTLWLLVGGAAVAATGLFGVLCPRTAR
jgi:hypothetical protein